jgi:hypothetical protein
MDTVIFLQNYVIVHLLIFEKSMSHRNFEIAMFLGFSRRKTKTFIFQSSVSKKLTKAVEVSNSPSMAKACPRMQYLFILFAQKAKYCGG